MGSKTNLETRKLIRTIRVADPVYNFLLKISNNSFVLFAIAALVYFVYHYLVLSVAGYLNTVEKLIYPPNHTLWERLVKIPIDVRIINDGSIVIGFFQNLGDLIIVSLLIPIGIAGYIWQPVGIGSVVDKFRKNEVILSISDKGEKHYGKKVSYAYQVRILRKWLAPRWLPLTLVIIFLLVDLSHYFPQYLKTPDDFISWRNALQPVFRPFELLASNLAYYCSITMGWRSLVFTIWVIGLFQNNLVKIYPTHPDQVGGFGSLGEYLSKFSYIIMTGGITVVSFALLPQDVWHSSNSISIQFQSLLEFVQFTFAPLNESILSRGPSLILYLTLTPIIFFGPIIAGSKAMKRAKEIELARITEIYTKEYAFFFSLSGNSASNKNEINSRLEYLAHLRELKKAIEKYPTSPTKTLYVFSSFNSAILAPLVIAVLDETLIKWLLN